jgi:hypothetical protein
MPLQNRVRPDGDIIMAPEKGMFMGNRGILHNDQQQLGVSRWKHPHWIICLTSFKGRHRKVMTPRRYTELFFLDDATALAAGHRPCAECRRADYNAYISAISAATGKPAFSAPELDRKLHEERVTTTRKQITHAGRLEDLPDGVIIRRPDKQDDLRLVMGNKLMKWRMQGYVDDGTKAESIPDKEPVEVLTPPTSVLALKAGFNPVLSLDPDARHDGSHAGHKVY